jgi:hypothetical protein
MKNLNFQTQSKSLKSNNLKQNSSNSANGGHDVLSLDGQLLLNGKALSAEDYSKIYTSDIKLRIIH